MLSARSEQGEDLTNASVLLDGKLFRHTLDGRAAELNPGSHTFRFLVPGRPPVDKPVVVLEREKGRLIDARFQGAAATTTTPDGAPPADTPQVPRREVTPLVVVLGGVGVLGLASGTYFGVRGLSARSDLESCRPCSEARLDSVRTQYHLSEASFGIGLAAAAAALILHFTQDDPRVSSSAPRAWTFRLDSPRAR